MRNICFCDSTDPLIVLGKGYSTPIQSRHNENLSLFTQPSEITIYIRFFIFLYSFFTLILHVLILLVHLCYMFLSHRLKNNIVKLYAIKAMNLYKANMIAMDMN